MPTSVHLLIERHRTKASELRRQLEVVEAELRGMELVAHALPAGAIQSPGEYRKRRGRGAGRPSGRQRGALSERWRRILACLYVREEWFTAERVVEVVRELEDRAMKPAEVRRLFNGYVDSGLVEANDANQYRVKPEAAARFRVDETQGVELLSSDVNEPPAERTTDGSDVGGWGVAAPQPPKGHSNLGPAA